LKLIIDLFEQIFIGSYLYILKLENGGESNNSPYYAYSALFLLTAIHLLGYFGIIFITENEELAQNIYLTGGVTIGIAGFIWLLFIRGGKYIKLRDKHTNLSRCFKVAVAYNMTLVIAFFSVISYLITQV